MVEGEVWTHLEANIIISSSELANDGSDRMEMLSGKVDLRLMHTYLRLFSRNQIVKFARFEGPGFMQNLTPTFKRICLGGLDGPG